MAAHGDAGAAAIFILKDDAALVIAGVAFGSGLRVFPIFSWVGRVGEIGWLG